MDLHLRRPAWLQLLLNARSAEISTEPQILGTIPQSDQPGTWWQVDYIGLFPLWERQ